MKSWIECGVCAYSWFPDASADVGRCRLHPPRLISAVQEPQQNALTRKVELRTGSFGGQPHVRRADGCAEGRPETVA